MTASSISRRTGATAGLLAVGLMLSSAVPAQSQGKIRFNAAAARPDRMLLKTQGGAASALAPDVEGFRVRVTGAAGTAHEETLGAWQVVAHRDGGRWKYVSERGALGIRKLQIRRKVDAQGVAVHTFKLRLDSDLAAVDPERTGLAPDDLADIVVDMEVGDDILRLAANWERKARGWRLGHDRAGSRPLYFGEAKRVFVSSDCHAGDLGGLAGADATCQGLATMAGLGGSFVAWLADAYDGPASRLPHAAEPYVLVDGSVVARDWADLTDGALLSPIMLDEWAESVAESETCGTAVWTNSTPEGTTAVSDGLEFACLDWTLALFSRWGLTGDAMLSGVGWSDGGAFGLVRCSLPMRLYCFER